MAIVEGPSPTKRGGSDFGSRIHDSGLGATRRAGTDFANLPGFRASRRFAEFSPAGGLYLIDYGCTVEPLKTHPR